MTPGVTSDRRAWVWAVLAGAAGWLAAFVFSSVLRWPRPQFLLAYVPIVVAVTLWYQHGAGVSLRTQFARRWKAGLIVGVVFGALLVRQVLAQPPSARPEGLALAASLAWEGVSYGMADAVLLSVLPVLALYGARSAAELSTTGSRLRWALVALVGSTLVTAAYHAGFTEYRGARLLPPLVGNGLMTLSYLLSGSPVAPVVSHVMMHAAAVLHGMETTTQLPPHY